MIRREDMHDLGRVRGVWVPLDEVETLCLFCWDVAEVVPGHERVLMTPPAEERERAA